MRLLELEIMNFRSFAHAEMNLKASGVIGIRGLNGAGKSSIFEAVLFALYGPRHGKGRAAVRRDNAPTGEPTSVVVSFTHDERLVEVSRGEQKASISIDGAVKASTRTATTAEVTRLLGLDRNQFLATFYARQKEVESFATRGERLHNIKRLLGLTRLQKAAEIGRADLKAHETIVATLANDAPDIEKGKALVVEGRSELEVLSKPITAAEMRCEALSAQHATAWARLTQAEADAQRLEAARGELRLAVDRAKRATADRSAAAQALQEAQLAHEQVGGLAAVAAKVPELQATVGQFELRQQANRDYAAKREARAEAQSRLAHAQDELAKLSAPKRSSEELADHLSASENELSRLTEELLAGQGAIGAAREAAAAAVLAQQNVSRSEALRGELAALKTLERDSAKTQSLLMELETRKGHAQRELSEESEHASEVRRDGPDAKCLRCRRAYGDQFTNILSEFNATIDRLTTEVATLERQLTETRPRETKLSAQIAELRRKEGELASLGANEVEPAKANDAKQRLAELTEAAIKLEGRRAELTTAGNATRSELKAATMLETALKHAADGCARIEAEVQLLSGQLAERTPETYDPRAHQDAIGELSEARTAEETCRRLGALAESVELCEHRDTATQTALTEATTDVARRTEALTSLSAEVQPLAEAREHVETLAQELQEAQSALSQLTQTQVRHKKNLEMAETALRNARREQRRLRDAQVEMRIVKIAADGLHDYALEAQRRAIPRLETETSELLARLSGGAYNDVKLDDHAALALLDAGEHRALERFSGGEQDMAHLCLRLALSRTFAASRGTDPGMIILDEVFGSQDLERRKTLLAHLGQLEEEYDQVFVISHFDDVTEAADVQFEVRKTAGVSEILPV
jgi:exonuclease SbcC